MSMKKLMLLFLNLRKDMKEEGAKEEGALEELMKGRLFLVRRKKQEP